MSTAHKSGKRGRLMKYIKGAKIITETQVIEDHILGFDSNFRSIIPSDDFSDMHLDALDAEDLYIAPGLIDIHIHGSGGYDVMDGTDEAIRGISASIVKTGVTSFLATTMTMDRDRISCSLNRINLLMKEDLPGAQLLGAHLEGPFISSAFKGAQNSEFIVEPDWNLIEPYKDTVKIVTIAPEQPGAKELIKKIKENGIVASMGHTAATYDEAMEGIEAGVSHCTHLFNAMSGVHHRNPGAAVAALSSDVICEFLADKIHIHTGLFELVRKAKGVDQIILITDCIEAGGMSDGTYALGGQPVIVKNGEARLADGVLAGSVARLNQCLRNFYLNTKTELFEVFKMASINPARELKIDGFKGSVAIGKDADFILIDKDFNIKSTFLKGECVFENK